MQKVNIFLTLLIVSIFSLIILFLVMLYVLPSSPTQPDWWTNMWGHMGGMMGGTGSVSNPSLGYFGILFVVVIGIVIVSAVGLVYFVMLPEIKTSNKMPQNIEDQNLNGFQNSGESSAYESVLKTLNEDEKKVLKVLRDHNGKYLQKYIRHEAKLSRLKTHRILARFAERGMVSLQKSGNTNEVTLADWLQQ
jgi:hypothetical protein